jgi:L-aspartate oxidase
MNAFHDDLDVLVIGSGIAGLSAAIALAGQRRVAVISKEDAGGGSTELAQGGIAAVLGPPDSARCHATDTLVAAAGLGDARVAAEVTAEAADAVNLLARLGVHFDDGPPAREGGHSAARVVHARGDATGAEISRALMQAARGLGVPVVGGMFLLDLATEGGRVAGAIVWDRSAGTVRRVSAATVILATGGYGHLWASTTSPEACSGDGLAAALRAGAQAADLEFVQFHPTGMALGGGRRPLASEALRGAGARLRDAAGELLHPLTEPGMGDLAPRDVVSASMARRMAELGADHCYLDATVLDPLLLESHFPTFVAACRAAGIEPKSDWVPVSPTAHYTMGGVLSDADGRTTLEGLMAVGEVACNGLHGANRLASNSLLEGAVVGRRAARAVLEADGPVAPRAPAPFGPGPIGQARLGSGPLGPALGRVPLFAPGGPGREQLRSAMQEWAGVTRDATGLEYLASWLGGRANGASSAGAGAPPSAPPGSQELANMTLVARGVVTLALRREESRGAHRRADFPSGDPRWLVRQAVQLLPDGTLAVGELPVAGARSDEVDGVAETAPEAARVPAAAGAR